MDDNTFNDHEPAPLIKANVPTETGMVSPYAVFRQRNSSGSALFRGDSFKCDYQTGEWQCVHGKISTLIGMGSVSSSTRPR